VSYLVSRAQGTSSIPPSTFHNLSQWVAETRVELVAVQFLRALGIIRRRWERFNPLVQECEEMMARERRRRRQGKGEEEEGKEGKEGGECALPGPDARGLVEEVRARGREGGREGGRMWKFC
jgi:hypothetical protein